MADLTPIPFDILATRLFSDLAAGKGALDLPNHLFYSGRSDLDLSMSFPGGPVSTPFGPAAGPHTQLAQNIVLAWLCGGRFMELKTVQVMDELKIVRPCIDMQTVGFNVEWSQELKLDQSLEEYVKASMLVEMLKADGLAVGHAETVFDMSVGYDLAGISSPPIRAFLSGLMDARTTVERLRAQIPDALARFRDLPFRTCISDTLTLSTFHGCPPDEIEAIASFLLRDMGLNVVVKLNPTLLGRETLFEILHDRLGYTDLIVPDSAFAGDPSWADMVGIITRLGDLAAQQGRDFGVKFCNTLLVKNYKSFFPAVESNMYMSGQPLHLLAMALVRKFRAEFGDRYRVSFSAGINEQNFADAVALSLKPVTVCSDLLKAGGYGRGAAYLTALEARMTETGAHTLDEFVIKAFGHGEAALDGLGLPSVRVDACRAALQNGGDLAAAAGEAFPAWVSACVLRNTDTYVVRALDDPRYTRAKHDPAPLKLKKQLAMFDCVNCNKCISVCPNNANLVLAIEPGTYSTGRLVPSAAGWSVETTDPIEFRKPWQIGNFIDACNECGNCEVICPENRSPCLIKPRFFGSLAAWQAAPTRDGYALVRDGETLTMFARVEGKELRLEHTPGAKLRYVGEGFDIRVDLDDPLGSVEGQADAAVDLRQLRLMELLRLAVIDAEASNYVKTALEMAESCATS
ncbi:glutamate synthase [Propionivibrio dicarboxylicus]|uniref:Putative selenate reductase n=1 Tax=Propionivibrio dicarboxylicus TaxID=83767 RepID=A0A1G7WX35_9RHOO|nr:glutamate synthase [Propionivibrio dicarboxylicus]SDG76503.1 putative selenate reductase [Propionivibrio dicarboxylicus]